MQTTSNLVSCNRFFSDPLAKSDPDIFDLIQKEHHRQQNHIELIASENLISRAVLEAQGSILTNKYAEGYPGNRYYGGCKWVDKIENICIERAKRLFNCSFVNVQAHSGSQMNQAVFLALLQPGDCFMGLDLNSGGHLTHGSSVNLSGKWFHPIPYNVAKKDHLLDMEEVLCLAKKHKPKLIIAGGTSYSRLWDFKAFREIADEVEAYLMVDMSHFSGLVVGGVHPSPFPYAHIVTSTTHKSLRGPRGGIICTNDEIISKKINSAVFPGLQGGPFMHTIAAKAVAFKEALMPEFKLYAASVVANAKALATSLQESGFDIVSGGTDNHLLVVNLQPHGCTGLDAEQILTQSSIVCNKNGIPFDSQKPSITSGIRLGTPACTTRGFGTQDFLQVGSLIAQLLHGFLKHKSSKDFTEVQQNVAKQIDILTRSFPIYS